MKIITDETMQLPSHGDGVRFVSVELQKVHPHRGMEKQGEEKRKKGIATVMITVQFWELWEQMRWTEINAAQRTKNAEIEKFLKWISCTASPLWINGREKCKSFP